MIAPEYFNNHIAVEGEIIVKGVPNDTGFVLVWNHVTKKIGRRTHAEIISDLGLATVSNLNGYVTLSTPQNIIADKNFEQGARVIISGNESNNTQSYAISAGVNTIVSGWIHSFYGNNWKVGLKRGSNGGPSDVKYAYSFSPNGNDYDEQFAIDANTGNLEINGAITKLKNNTRTFHNVYQGYEDNVGFTGVLAIKFPQVNAAQTMFMVDINLYGYNQSYLGKVQVSFYKYFNSIITTGSRAVLNVSDTFPTDIVRVGIDGAGLISICFGDHMTFWNGYIGIQVERVQTQYGVYNEDWSYGWTHTLEDGQFIGYPVLTNIIADRIATRNFVVNSALNDYWKKNNVGGSYWSLESDRDVALLNNNQAQRILTGGLLVSGSYSHSNLVPNQGAYINGIIKTGTHFEGVGFYNNGLAGAQIINSNSNTLYIGNPAIPTLYIESADSEIYHNKAGHGAGNIWTSHNFNPNHYIPTSHPLYNISQNDINNWLGYTGYYDDRIIEPNQTAVQKLRFGFTSWDNNNGYPYADYIHFGGYQDSSGGNQNLIVINKSTFGIRQYQGLHQSISSYSDYADYFHTGSPIDYPTDVLTDIIKVGSPAWAKRHLLRRSWNPVYGDYSEINVPGSADNSASFILDQEGRGYLKGNLIWHSANFNPANYYNNQRGSISNQSELLPTGSQWISTGNSGSNFDGELANKTIEGTFTNFNAYHDGKNLGFTLFAGTSTDQGIYYKTWYSGGQTEWRRLIDSKDILSYTTQANLNAQLSAYATLAGVQTFTNTTSFSQSPAVPNGTLGTHAVNLNQLLSVALPYSWNWSGSQAILDRRIIGELAWKNYGNGHTIFDASSSLAPWGASISNTDAQIPWSPSYPTLMGGNGSETYGVRVDSARVADSIQGYSVSDFTKAGGVNLFPNSPNFRLGANDYLNSDNSVLGQITVFGTANWNAYASSVIKEYTSGAYLTFQIEVLHNDTEPRNFTQYFYYPGGTLATIHTAVPPNVWTKIYTSGKTDAIGGILIGVASSGMPAGTVVKYRNIQVEESRVASTYRPALEDSNINDYWKIYDLAGFRGINTDKPFAILNNGEAQKVYTNGVLVSNAYQDEAEVPAQGIFAQGNVRSNSWFYTSQDNKGIEFFGGTRVYKKFGAGLVFNKGNNQLQPKVENADGSQSWEIWTEENLNPFKNLRNTSDLDSVAESGIYRQEGPSSGFNYTTTLNMNSADGRQQLTVERGGAGMKFRGTATGSGNTGWSEWNEVIHSGNITSHINNYGFVTQSNVNTQLSGKANALENALAIGFSSGNADAAPYFYHSTAGYRFLATQTWTEENFARRDGTNALETWLNASQGITNNPYIPGKTLNSSGNGVYLNAATNGNIMGYINTAGADSGNPTDDWWFRIKMLHNNTSGYYGEIGVRMTGGINSLRYKRFENGNDGGWIEVWDKANLSPGSINLWNLAYNYTISDVLNYNDINGDWTRYSRNDGSTFDRLRMGTGIIDSRVQGNGLGGDGSANLPNSGISALNHKALPLFHSTSQLGWSSSLIFKGWTDSYKAWKIMGPADNNNSEQDFYLSQTRSDNGQWMAERKIWTSKDFSQSHINAWNNTTNAVILNQEFSYNTGYGLGIYDDYFGGESGIIDNQRETFIAGKIGEYYKYGSSVHNGLEGINYHWEKKNIGIGGDAESDNKVRVEGCVKATENFKSKDEKADTMFIPNGQVATLRDEIINDESDYAIRLDPHEYEIDSSGYLEVNDRNRLIHIIGEQIKMVVDFREIYPKQQIVIYNFDPTGNTMAVKIHGKTIYQIESSCFLRLYVTKSLRVIAERQQPCDII